jgi:hypothetical protein
MAITRKPKPARAAGPVDVEALINKGGSVAQFKAAAAPAASPVIPVILRLPSGILGRIDDAVKARPVKMPRHTWILEAIVEKLAQQG